MDDDIWAQKTQAIIDPFEQDHSLDEWSEEGVAKLRDSIATALRSAAAGAGERMRERAAKACDKEIEHWRAQQFWESAMQARDLAAIIRALPLDEELTDG